PALLTLRARALARALADDAALFGEEHPLTLPLVEHHVVLQETEVADDRVDLSFARPVGIVLAVGVNQHVAINHPELVMNLTKEAGVVGVPDAGRPQHLQRDEGRADAAEIVDRSAAVRPDDQWRLV